MGPSIKHHIERATISVENLAQLNRNDVADVLKINKFCRITGILDPDAIRHGQELLKQQFDYRKDNAVHGESPESVQNNFQKLSIGRARHGGVDRPRFMRVFYNPIWSDDIYSLRETFTRLAKVRNILGGQEADFAIDQPEGGVWTAARIHHFPVVGGFMVTH